MFDSLSERLGRTIKNREVRMALLEADVALPVVKQLTEAVQLKALGQEVIGSLSPGQALIKVVSDELVAVMGESAVPRAQVKRQRLPNWPDFYLKRKRRRSWWSAVTCIGQRP